MPPFFTAPRSWHFYALATAAILVLAAAAEYWIGHPWICECGNVKLWYGNNYSPENSQHLADWYTFSHIIHGFLFFALLRGAQYLFPRSLGKLSLGWLFVIAVGIEAAWEVFENTEFIMNRYREATVSLDYFGDSILNSMMDIAWMMAGFALAYRLPVWVSVVLVIAMEVVVGAIIRDNLALNIIMLIYPLDAIREWQTGG